MKIMAKIICFKVYHLIEFFIEKMFHDPTGGISKSDFFRFFPSTTYHWIEITAVPIGIIAMVFGFFAYMPNIKDSSKTHWLAELTTDSYHDFSQAIFTFGQVAVVEVFFLFLISTINTTFHVPEICKGIFLIICILLELLIQFHVYAFLGGTCRKVFLFITIGLAILIYPIIYPILSCKEKRRNSLNNTSTK